MAAFICYRCKALISPETTCEEAISFLKKLESCSGLAAKLILLRNFCNQSGSNN